MELNDRLPPPPRCQPNTAPMRVAHSLNSITRDNTNTVLGSKYKLCESVVKNMEKVLASPLQSENLQILWWREQKSADFLSASAAAEQPSEQIWPDMSLRQPKIQTEASKFTLSERLFFFGFIVFPLKSHIWWCDTAGTNTQILYVHMNEFVLTLKCRWIFAVKCFSYVAKIVLQPSGTITKLSRSSSTLKRDSWWGLQTNATYMSKSLPLLWPK